MEVRSRQELAALVHWIYARGWAPGTGGNFSLILNRDPLRVLITPSGADKGTVAPEELLIVDSKGSVMEGAGKPSAETLLHTTIAEETDATAIVHTHTIWNTLCSLHPETSLTITGFEMVKGLAGVLSHEQTVEVPILDNSQDIPALANLLRGVLKSKPRTQGVLLKGHGLYTWGCDIFEARRHLEVLEFLFELTERKRRQED